MASFEKALSFNQIKQIVESKIAEHRSGAHSFVHGERPNNKIVPTAFVTFDTSSEIRKNNLQIQVHVTKYINRFTFASTPACGLRFTANKQGAETFSLWWRSMSFSWLSVWASETLWNPYPHLNRPNRVTEPEPSMMTTRTRTMMIKSCCC